MTLERLNVLCKKHNIPSNVILQSDTGWECSETDMNGVFYNKQENIIIFTQETDSDNYYIEKEEWTLLEE